MLVDCDRLCLYPFPVQKTVVINTVGLTPSLLGPSTPRLLAFSQAGKLATIGPVLPAVTTTVQSTYLTGTWPTDHGIVGNGWYFREECEIKFWKQANALVQKPKIWDLAKGASTQTIKGHTDALNSISFSPDATQVVTTSKDKTVRVWDVAGAKEIATFKVERMVETKDAKGKVSQTKELGREFTSAVFTSDGKKIIAGNLDGVIKVYDVESKKEAREMKAHEGIWALALSPDGTKLASGGYDQTIKIWNVADGKDLRTIKAHLGTVTSLSFSADGQWLASGSIDGTVKVWSVK